MHARNNEGASLLLALGVWPTALVALRLPALHSQYHIFDATVSSGQAVQVQRVLYSTAHAHSSFEMQYHFQRSACCALQCRSLQ
jgi:hypothetical protein